MNGLRQSFVACCSPIAKAHGRRAKERTVSFISLVSTVLMARVMMGEVEGRFGVVRWQDRKLRKTGQNETNETERKRCFLLKRTHKSCAVNKTLGFGLKSEPTPIG